MEELRDDLAADRHHPPEARRWRSPTRCTACRMRGDGITTVISQRLRAAEPASRTPRCGRVPTPRCGRIDGAPAVTRSGGTPRRARRVASSRCRRGRSTAGAAPDTAATGQPGAARVTGVAACVSHARPLWIIVAVVVAVLLIAVALGLVLRRQRRDQPARAGPDSSAEPGTAPPRKGGTYKAESGFSFSAGPAAPDGRRPRPRAAHRPAAGRPGAGSARGRAGRSAAGSPSRRPERAPAPRRRASRVPSARRSARDPRTVAVRRADRRPGTAPRRLPPRRRAPRPDAPDSPPPRPLRVGHRRPGAADPRPPGSARPTRGPGPPSARPRAPGDHAAEHRPAAGPGAAPASAAPTVPRRPTRPAADAPRRPPRPSRCPRPRLRPRRGPAVPPAPAAHRGHRPGRGPAGPAAGPAGALPLRLRAGTARPARRR